jgi:spoIIIJ-associated protein
MPKQYEAKTLEEAYEKASKSLNCSIVDLHIEVLQSPSKGLFGLFSKQAVIQAKVKKNNFSKENRHKKEKKVKVQTLETKLNEIDSPAKEEVSTPNKSAQIQKEKIFEGFYNSDEKPANSKITIKKENEDLKNEIHEKINDLFSKLCYEIDEIKVDILEDSQTVYVEFSGEDSALLIGKEGYKYKALSYILFNWINEKYGMMLRLEVAQFLVNQEESIHNYLLPVIEVIKEEGFYKTKPLDGILVHIALTKLRNEFPDKYVAVKTNARGEKYILVNEYKN